MGKHWKCFWVLSLFLTAECFAANLRTDTLKTNSGNLVISGNARITGTLKAVTPPAGAIPDSMIGLSVNGFVTVPSASLTGGGSGPVLRENVIGFFDTTFYSRIPDLPDTFAPSPHIHDDRYYRETEVNNLLLNKLDLHAVADSAGGSARLGGQGKTYYDTVGNGGNRSRANHTGTQAISTVVGLSDSLTNHRNLINSKEPAVTGAADKVLSVQSDGTGLKTGTLVDNGSFSRSTSDFVVDYNLYVNGLTADKIVESNTSKMLVSVNKGTAYNKNFGSTAGTVSEGNHGHTGVYQPLNAGLTSLSGFGAIPGFPYYEGNGSFTKKYFGADEGYICEANDPRLSDSRTPTAHAINGVQHTGWSDWFDQAVKTVSNVTHNILTLTGSLIGAGANGLQIYTNTSDGSDTKRLLIGHGDSTRGAYVGIYDNEHGYRGKILAVAGAGSGGTHGSIDFYGPFNLAGSALISGTITSSDGNSYVQLFNNSGTGRAMLKAYQAGLYLTASTALLGDADAVAIYRDAGDLGPGKTLTEVLGILQVDDDAHIAGKLYTGKRNVGSQTTLLANAQLNGKDMDDYREVSHFTVNKTYGGGAYIYFVDAQVGDEIFIQYRSTIGDVYFIYDESLTSPSTWSAYTMGSNNIHAVCTGSKTRVGPTGANISCNSWAIY